MKPICPEIESLKAVIYAKDDPTYLPLPASRTDDGEVVTCWKLSVWERLQALFCGRFYVTLLTYNRPLQPLRVGLSKPEYTDWEMGELESSQEPA